MKLITIISALIFATNASAFDYVTDLYGNIVEDQYGDPVEEFNGQMYYGGTSIPVPESDTLWTGSVHVGESETLYWKNTSIPVNR